MKGIKFHLNYGNVTFEWWMLLLNILKQVVTLDEPPTKTCRGEGGDGLLEVIHN